MENNPLAVVHQALISQFADIKRVMDAHGIPYAMMHGTLLGVVRHQGIIPWDDDIDLVMTREAFERFEKVYPAEADTRYFLTYTHTWTPRVMSKDSAADAFVDFFILDTFPDGAFLRKMRVLGLKLLQGMLKRNVDYSRFTITQQWLLRLTHLMGLPFKTQTKTRWYHRLSTASKRGKMVHMSNAAFGLLGEAFDKADFVDLVEGDFEGMRVSVPRNYHGVLCRLYGDDYMTPPPPDQRAPRHLDL